jgi:hypothetical protein
VEVGTTGPASRALLLAANTAGIVLLTGLGLLVLLLTTADGGTGAPAASAAPSPVASATATPVPVPPGLSLPHWDANNGWLSEFR